MSEDLNSSFEEWKRKQEAEQTALENHQEVARAQAAVAPDRRSVSGLALGLSVVGMALATLYALDQAPSDPDLPDHAAEVADVAPVDSLLKLQGTWMARLKPDAAELGNEAQLLAVCRAVAAKATPGTSVVLTDPQGEPVATCAAR